MEKTLQISITYSKNVNYFTLRNLFVYIIPTVSLQIMGKSGSKTQTKNKKFHPLRRLVQMVMKVRIFLGPKDNVIMRCCPFQYKAIDHQIIKPGAREVRAMKKTYYPFCRIFTKT
jgi:hypothetical protein